MEKMEKNIYPTEACVPLSKLLVELAQELKRGGKKTLNEFCSGLGFNPVDLLYLKGFQALIIFAALVPLKEKLEEKEQLVEKDKEWQRLRIARNAMCHGTYEFNDDWTVVTFQNLNQDSKKSVTITMSPKEIIDLANRFQQLLKT
jgi:hypothetical protein